MVFFLRDVNFREVEDVVWFESPWKEDLAIRAKETGM